MDYWPTKFSIRNIAWAVLLIRPRNILQMYIHTNVTISIHFDTNLHFIPISEKWLGVVKGFLYNFTIANVNSNTEFD